MRRDDGFSLIEMVVVVGLLVTLMLPVYRFHDSITQKEADVAVAGDQQANIRLAMDGVVRELRQANSGGTGNEVTSIGASAVTFLSPDRATPYHMRRIEYAMSGTNLQRRLTVSTNTSPATAWTWGTTGTWRTVVQRVVTTGTPVIFQYKNAAGAATTTLSAVKTIVVTLRIDPTNTNRAPSIQTYATTVEVRDDQA